MLVLAPKMIVLLDTLSLPMCTDQTEHHAAAAAGKHSLQERPEPLGKLEELLLVPDVVQQPLDDEVAPGVDAELLFPGVNQPGVHTPGHRDSKGISKLTRIQLILPYKISCTKGSSEIL